MGLSLPRVRRDAGLGLPMAEQARHVLRNGEVFEHEGTPVELWFVPTFSKTELSVFVYLIVHPIWKLLLRYVSSPSISLDM
jgi:hypothetical protein